jgi:hypothetical protein
MKEHWRRRIAGLFLVIGVGLTLTTLSQHQRQDNTLIFRFDSDVSARMRRLSASWTPVGEVEASGGVVLDFPSGARRQVSHKLTIARGDYVISLQIEPPELARELNETSLVRRVTLSGTDVIIPVSRLPASPPGSSLTQDRRTQDPQSSE